MSFSPATHSSWLLTPEASGDGQTASSSDRKVAFAVEAAADALGNASKHAKSKKSKGKASKAAKTAKASKAAKTSKAAKATKATKDKKKRKGKKSLLDQATGAVGRRASVMPEEAEAMHHPASGDGKDAAEGKGLVSKMMAQVAGGKPLSNVSQLLVLCFLIFIHFFVFIDRFPVGPRGALRFAVVVQFSAGSTCGGRGREG